jgi:hypothetical protein
MSDLKNWPMPIATHKQKAFPEQIRSHAKAPSRKEPATQKRFEQKVAERTENYFRSLLCFLRSLLFEFVLESLSWRLRAFALAFTQI